MYNLRPAFFNQTTYLLTRKKCANQNPVIAFELNNCAESQHSFVVVGISQENNSKF